MNTITTLIPQYGELNRISKDWIVSHTFSFEKQKFIVDFYSEWSDIKAFEQAILELVLHTPPEPCTLLLKSLKKEVREYTRLYEAYSLPHDEVIMRVCNQYADSYKEAIKEEMEVVNRLRKPMNEANNRYDTIGYREHTPEEEKLAEREYERCKAEYEKEKAQLDHLYEQQTLLRKEARQSGSRSRSRCGCRISFRLAVCTVLLVCFVRLAFFIRYIFGQDAHEVYAKQVDVIAMVFHVLPGFFPEKDKWKEAILKHLDMDEDYYKSKYREPVSDLPSIPNQKFAKEMDGIFR